MYLKDVKYEICALVDLIVQPILFQTRSLDQPALQQSLFA